MKSRQRVDFINDWGGDAWTVGRCCGIHYGLQNLKNSRDHGGSLIAIIPTVMIPVQLLLFTPFFQIGLY
jgi:hypothetical protein